MGRPTRLARPRRSPEERQREVTAVTRGGTGGTRDVAPRDLLSADDPRMVGLRRFNLAMAALHLAQGVAMLLVSSSFALPVTASFLRMDTATNSLEPVPRTLVELPIGPLVAAFLLLSAAAHLVVSLPGVFDWYAANLRRRANYARWAEYALSSSLMMVVIAMLVGIYDVAALLLAFAANAAMILFGWVMEAHNQTTDRTRWTAYVFGSLVGIVPWIAVGSYLAGAGSGVPTFVYGIYASIFVFFNVFAVNMLLQYRRVGKWRDYLFGERAYIVLSLVAKSLLAWQVFAGTLQPA
jgi:hypothetical protein